MSPFVSLRPTQANFPQCSHRGPPFGPDPPSWGLSQARSTIGRKGSGSAPEDSDGLLCDEGVADADPSGDW